MTAMARFITMVALPLVLVLACGATKDPSDPDPVKEAFDPYLFDQSLEEAIEIIGANPDTLPLVHHG